MEKLVLATKNNHKISELQKMLGDSYKILSLSDIGFNGEIIENGKSLAENSIIKAKTVYDFLQSKKLNYMVLADDTGLLVDALNGEPGINSARYSGDHDDAGNRKKLLKKLENIKNRNAHFECVITLIKDRVTTQFIGQTFGEITREPSGSDAFGYDCIFYSDDLGKTFGDASSEEKNSVSHRGRAIQKLMEFLKS